jgi:DNA repair protein RadD
MLRYRQVDKTMTFTLHDHQNSAITETRKLLATLPPNERRVVLQMATGAGKTVAAAEIASLAVDKGGRVLFVCDTLELVEQALATFDRYELRTGVMQAKHERTNLVKPVQVCSQATLAGWIKRGKLADYQVDLIIHDESHMQYKVREALCELYPNAVVIGLTATPFAKGMGVFYKGIVSAIPMQELIDKGFLCDYKVFAPSKPNMKGATMSGKDWNPNAAAERYTGDIHADIVKTWKAQGQGRRTLMFACNVLHSKALVAEFVSAGVNAVHVDGYPSDEGAIEDRFQIIQRFREGSIDVLSNVALCTKGFDAPEVSCLVIARPTKSLSLHWQMLGRGLRTAPGKDSCIVLDHAGNALLHGLPTDITEFELCNGTKNDSDKRKKEAPLPVPCGSCGVLKAGGAHLCPNCGFAPEKKNEIVNVDGELIEYKTLIEKKKKEVVFTKEQKQEWWSGFLFHQYHRGYSAGWASHIYRKKFGVWPAQLAETRTSPTTEVRSFITSQQIRYVKGKGRARA